MRVLAAEDATTAAGAAVAVENPDGAGAFVILCDHASNHVPAELADLGLDRADLQRHIAWDPGALPVARGLAAALDAPLVRATVSRLVLDVNRTPEARDSIPVRSEDTDVPGNRDLAPEEHTRRIASLYEPYHAAVDDVLRRRAARGLATALVAIHTFTPVYRGAARPWHVGILHDADTRMARPLIEGLAREAGVAVGDNEPYSPADGVYHTLERHRGRPALPTVMIEIRNDLVAGGEGQTQWTERLARTLRAIEAAPDARQRHAK